MYMAGKIDDEGLKRAIDAAYTVIKSQRKNKVVLMGDVVLSPVERIEYPVKIDFSSVFFNINGTKGGIGGEAR
jgi:2-phospho-L-lactate guanylyltransferase (CobY/MobA/RfbA family)